jgi:AcrR family transcriptional regulator
LAAEPRPPRQPAPALHYHFASNAELGEALIARYAASFTGALAALDSDAMTAPAITGVPRLGGTAKLSRFVRDGCLRLWYGTTGGG